MRGRSGCRRAGRAEQRQSRLARAHREGNAAHPAAVLDQLLAVDLVQARDAHVVALGVDEAAAQLLVLAPHRLEHHLGRWFRRVAIAQEGVQPEACIDG